jgi:hypothetical protein
VRSVLALIVLALCAAPAAYGQDESLHPVIREEGVVRVDGVSETWRLEWQDDPSQVCGPADTAGWYTCPCHGFEFGEEGVLDLVRLRGGKEIERMPLTPLFADVFGSGGVAILPRWPSLPSDVDASSKADLNDALTELFAKRVMARTPVRILRFVDADHDGRATEFLLQIDSFPCDSNKTIAVGVTRARPQLHVFGTAEHPDKPLVMSARDWKQLVDAPRPIRFLSRDCDFEDGDIHTELELSTDEHGIHAAKDVYQCLDTGEKGPTTREVL